MLRRALDTILLTASLTLAGGPAAAETLYVGHQSQIDRVDSSTGGSLGTINLPTASVQGIKSIAFDRLGDLLVLDGWDVSAPPHVVRVDPVSGQILGVVVASGVIGEGLDMVFGPDGRIYVLDRVGPQVLRFDGISGAALGAFVTNAPNAIAIAFGADANLYALGSDGGILRFNGTTGAPAGFLLAPGAVSGASAFTFGVDGSVYVSSGSTVKVFDGQTGALLRSLSPAGLLAAVQMLFAADGTLFLAPNIFAPGGVQRLSPAGSLVQLVSGSYFGLGLAIACNPAAFQTCMLGSRFLAQVMWQTPQAQAGQGRPIRYSDDTSEFWFFAVDNLEMIVKVLNGCGVNQRFWVFAGGLTNVSVTLTLTDTHTGRSKVYRNPQSTAFRPIQDTAAFGCP